MQYPFVADAAWYIEERRSRKCWFVAVSPIAVASSQFNPIKNGVKKEETNKLFICVQRCGAEFVLYDCEEWKQYADANERSEWMNERRSHTNTHIDNNNNNNAMVMMMMIMMMVLNSPVSTITINNNLVLTFVIKRHTRSDIQLQMVPRNSAIMYGCNRRTHFDWKEEKKHFLCAPIEIPRNK